MRAQRSGPPAVDATAEQLPFDDDSFDAAMATITIHQWRDGDAGLRELRRVSRGPVVILTFDATAIAEFWLREYVPEVIEAEARRYQPLDHIAAVLGGDVTVTQVPLALDCVDGFAEAFYGRPELLLDPNVRRSQSAWGFVDEETITRGLAKLLDEVLTGAWDERHGHLRTQPEYLGSLRLIVAA
jgi:SAM-dependent methyltransferase